MADSENIQEPLLHDILVNVGSNPTLDKLRTIAGIAKENPDNDIKLTPGMSARIMPAIPPGTNAFRSDVYNMGTRVARNMLVMHNTFEEQDAEYIILVNEVTGERVRILLTNPVPSSKE